METGNYKGKSAIQALFVSIDSCSEMCIEMEHLLVEMEESKRAAICVSLCRDFIDLGHMLGAFIQRESSVAIKIAEILQEIVIRLSRLLGQLNSRDHKIVEWDEQLKLCSAKINSYCISENSRLR